MCPEIGAEARGLGTTYKFDAATPFPKLSPKQQPFIFNRLFHSIGGWKNMLGIYDSI
jgi:hypothetical protein